MSAAEVPAALDSERNVAGCCAASHAGARLAHERLRDKMFWDPRCRRVFVASVLSAVEVAETRGCGCSGFPWCRAEPAPPWGGLSAGYCARLSAVATLASVPHRWLWQVVEDRPAMADRSGADAAKIRRAHELREALRVHIDAIAQLREEAERV